MAIKYVSKNKDGKWKVTATKTGSAVKVYPTQKEAIIYAATMNDVDAIMVKRENGWTLDSSWNKKVKEVAAKKVEAKKSRGKEASQAKAEVVAELATSTKVASKAKPTKTTKVATKPVAKKAVKPEVKKASKPEVKKVEKAAKKASKPTKKAVAVRTEIETQEISRVRKTDLIPLSEMDPSHPTERVTQVEGIVSSVVRPADVTPAYTPYIAPVDASSQHAVWVEKGTTLPKGKTPKVKTSKFGPLIAFVIVAVVIGAAFAVAFLI